MPIGDNKKETSEKSGYFTVIYIIILLFTLFT